MSADLQTFLENAQNDAVAARVRCGEQSNPRTIGVIFVGDSGLSPSKFPNFDPTQVETWEECADAIHEMLESVGYGVEPGEECARIHLLGDGGNQLRTWSRTKRVEYAPDQDATVLVCGELIRMGAEMRRSFGVLADALANQTEGREQAIMDMIAAHRSQVESQAQAELVQVLAEVEAGVEHEESDPLRAAAGNIITNLASQFLPNGVPGQALDPRSLVMQALKSDPAIARDLVNDPEIVQAFMDATEPMENFVESELETPSPSDALETPSPMDE